MQLAVALYNNPVDDEDELEFHKGDILTVLIENPHGLEGWWLCQHQGKFGLCPGNRLKLISSRINSATTKCNNFPSRISSASIYDVISSNHDYDNAQRTEVKIEKPIAEQIFPSFSDSSGFSSTVDLQLTSSSFSSSSNIENSNRIPSILSSIELKQLENFFCELSIRSNLLQSYSQLISQPCQRSSLVYFFDECQKFLRDYGYLLDRNTYRTIKENYLHEFEKLFDQSEQIVNNAQRILQNLKMILEIRSKQRTKASKLHQPIRPLIKETSYSTIQIHRRPTDIPQSKSHCSNLSSLSSTDDYLNQLSKKNPLINCYYRHVCQQVEKILNRYSTFNPNETNLSSITQNGKILLVGAQKLLFVLETLHEHLQQRQTLLGFLTQQLEQASNSMIQLLKQISQTKTPINYSQTITQFRKTIKLIVNIVKRIQSHCQSLYK